MSIVTMFIVRNESWKVIIPRKLLGSLSFFQQSLRFYQSDKRKNDEDIFYPMLWADEIYLVGPMKQSNHATDCLVMPYGDRELDQHKLR